MNKFILAAILVLALGWSQAAQAATGPPGGRIHQAAVRAAMQTQADAWNHSDLATFLAAYLQSPDTSATMGGQIAQGFDAVRLRYEQAYGGNRAAMGSMRYEDVTVTDLGNDYALAVGRLHIERPGQAPFDGVVSQVWMNTPQGWRILHDHRGAAVVATTSAGAATGSSPTPTPAPNSLVVEDIVVGNGQAAMYGNKVTVHYTGWLTSGQKFDSSVDRGQPFEFALGQHEVIRGWEQGILGMRVGGKRRLTIPPQLAYGSRGAGGGVIPPDATLIFEVELLGVGQP